MGCARKLLIWACATVNVIAFVAGKGVASFPPGLQARTVYFPANPGKKLTASLSQSGSSGCAGERGKVQWIAGDAGRKKS